MTDIPQSATHPNRRGFLGIAALVAAAPAAAILGPGLILASAAPADAASAGDLPSFAPVPPSAFGPALNADGSHKTSQAGCAHTTPP